MCIILNAITGIDVPNELIPLQEKKYERYHLPSLYPASNSPFLTERMMQNQHNHHVPRMFVHTSNVYWRPFFAAFSSDLVTKKKSISDDTYRRNIANKECKDLLVVEYLRLFI
mmetsp:Transcript_7523/g.10946  ORF Transcript_7523/g.10946 Transcript_7523/m.10946 type:complete len:113 (-) Transcript_7523:608-946(-)